MEWKKYLRLLELNQHWDFAIDFMQGIIEKNPNDVDVYIYTIYLLMNLLVEEDYDRSKHDYYASLLKKYFDESYIKFFNNAEYLFCVGTIAVMSEWYLGIEVEDYEEMLKKAMQLEPDNFIYKRTYYRSLNWSADKERTQIISYSKLILNDNLPLVQHMKSKGAFGEYWSNCLRGWFKRKIHQ